MENPYAAPSAPLTDTPHATEPYPCLWNPRAAAGWSLLFSPTFGAILHAMNWTAMGDAARARVARNWAIGSVLANIAVGVASVFTPDGGAFDLFSRFFGLLLLLTWYARSGRAQVDEVAKRFGVDYPRRGWAAPIAIAIAVIGAFFAAVVGVVFLSGTD